MPRWFPRVAVLVGWLGITVLSWEGGLPQVSSWMDGRATVFAQPKKASDNRKAASPKRDAAKRDVGKEEESGPPNPDQTALTFIEGLRERALFDLAFEYLETARKRTDLSKDFQILIDYEQGKTLLEEANRISDLERRRDLLEKARLKLLGFTKANPNHPQAPAAQAQFARMMIQRGELSTYQADEAKNDKEKLAKKAEAKEAYAQARTALDQAIVALNKSFDGFPLHLLRTDPRKAVKDEILNALMQAEFQRATVDYAEGQLYEPNDAKRNELLTSALERFRKLSDKYRTQLVGLYAKMWEGKSYEEQGKYGEAMGLFNQLMDHKDPRLGDLKRTVGFFRILVMEKRGEHALAADEATRWLAGNPNYALTSDGLGVMLHRAKNMDIQLEKNKAGVTKPEREAASKIIKDMLRQVVRIYSPHKNEALAMLKKYDPRALARAEDIKKMDFEEAIATAESRISEGNHEDAIPILRHAANRAEALTHRGTREKRAEMAEKLIRARYLLAYCAYMTQQYYTSIVIAEHLARRYPQNGLAAKATEIGLAAHIGAYNVFTAVDRPSDLRRLLDFADYVIKTWPETDQGNGARVTVGNIKMGQGAYADAIAAFDNVTEGSGRKADAITLAAQAHWRYALKLRREQKTEESQKQAALAKTKAQTAYDIRLQRRDASTDLARIDNAALLSEILLDGKSPDQALKILEPLSAELAAAARPSTINDAFIRVMTILLRSHIQAGKVDLALKDIGTLEKAQVAAETMVRLYLELGQLLETEMKALEAKGDMVGLNKTKADYNTFLKAMIDKPTGQTYESLQWAGEAKTALGEYAEAVKVFQRVMKEFLGTDAMTKPENYRKKHRTKLRLAAALRLKEDFSAAAVELAELLGQTPPLMEAMIEECRLMSGKAAAKEAPWSEAVTGWNKLARQLGAIKPRPPEYYEAYLELGKAMIAQGDKAKARTTLANVLTLNPKMPSDIKMRYQEMLKSPDLKGR